MAQLDIDPKDWATLSRLLDEALDLPETERGSWVDRLDAEFDRLRPQLRDLLARASEKTAPILEERPQPFGVTAGDASGEKALRDEKAGDLVGPYRLIRELAVGGMGVVWLAERADGFMQRHVALKLPRGAWERPALAERMAHEREILASLNHPNIARLYDAGITVEGLPYLALEYVDGERIDLYCRDRKLGVRERLTLFDQVARAVAHAHARLVIHRDLKPANILVTADGQVRLLDFGIARLLEGDRVIASQLTRVSGPVLTPHYASPEQVAGAPIGTASDIYSLGVVLFELLTGVRPYTLQRGTAAELEEAILRAEPPRPSTAVRDARLRKALRGDLDTIVLKSLKKDPDDRYATVAAMAEDLQRHVEGRPVLAQPDRASYRIGKFVRRNRAAVGAISAVFVALVAGIATTAWQAHVARVEKERAEEVKGFITSIFAEANPYQTGGRTPSLLDVLQEARLRIEHELVGRPRLRVEMLNLVGQSLISLGEVALAESAVQQSRTEADENLESDDPHRLHAHLLMVKVQRFRGRTGEMETELADLIPVLRRSRTAFPEDLIDALTQQAHFAIDAGRFPLAESAAVEAHTLAVRDLGIDHTRTAATAAVLAMAYVYAKQPGRALPAAQVAFDLNLGLHGPTHPLTIDARGILARALALSGQQGAAVAEMLRTADDAKGAFGADSAVVGFKMQNLAMEQLAYGQLAGALASAEEGVRILSQHSKPESFTMAAAYGARGRTLLAARRSADALPDLERTAEILASVVGAAHERTLHSRALLQVARARAGAWETAEAELQGMLAKAEQPGARWRVFHALGIVARLSAKPAEAVEHLEAARQILDIVPNANARDRLAVLAELGISQVDLGQYADGESNLGDAISRFSELQGEATPDRAEAWLGLGRALLAQGHPDEAFNWLSKADTFWAGFDFENRGAGEAAGWLAECERASGHPTKADTLRVRALAILARSSLPADRALVQRLARP